MFWFICRLRREVENEIKLAAEPSPGNKWTRITCPHCHFIYSPTLNYLRLLSLLH